MKILGTYSIDYGRGFFQVKNLISQSQNQQKIDVSKQKLGQGQQLFSQLFGTNQPQSNQQNQQQNQALPQQQQQII